jgi:predicted MFS family arabinose efflux permease
MNLIAQDERATASALNVIAWRLPNAASTVVGASILSAGDLNLPFYLCTVLYVTSISLFYALFRNAEKEPGLQSAKEEATQVPAPTS